MATDRLFFLSTEWHLSRSSLRPSMRFPAPCSPKAWPRNKRSHSRPCSSLLSVDKLVGLEARRICFGVCSCEKSQSPMRSQQDVEVTSRIETRMVNDCYLSQEVNSLPALVSHTINGDALSQGHGAAARCEALTREAPGVSVAVVEHHCLCLSPLSLSVF